MGERPQRNTRKEESNKLVKEGAEKNQPDRRDTHIPNKFLTQGAKLLTLNQVTTYQGFRCVKFTKDPQATVE